jgi:GTP diphosphokinase / guanosine-3',5'-bis(diphosphate) 3'-diphosphatase
MKRREREAWLENRIAALQDRLQKAEIAASVIGRPKHLYSIYRKMIQQMKDFDEVMDMQALRIITETTADCYNALGVVHRMWKPIPGRFKDYIPMPKPNGYQSIHTTVVSEEGKPLEVQIRTKKMDETAQVGIAAHWLYKEGDQRADRNIEERLKWLRQMYEALQETRSADEFLDGVRRDVQMSEVFAFTPKGDVKELPAGATPLDFAYLIHSDIGHHCMGARVNGRIVPLNYNLQTGDRVEILTSKSQTPHIGWLEIVASPRSRNKIRQRLRELGQLEPVEQEKDKEQPKHEMVRRPPVPRHPVRVVDEATRQKLIRVQGHKNMAVSFARCCNPMPGHAVVGYLTRNPGITIHQTDCRNFARTTRDPKRVIRVSWEGEAHYEIAMRVVTTPRPNMLADITDAIRPLAVEITTAKYQPGSNGHSDFEFVFNASDQGVVDRVTRTLRTVVGVSDVSALSVREVLER